MWQQNLMNNLIVFFVLGTLAIVIYCKIAKKTLSDLIREIRGGMSDDE